MKCSTRPLADNLLVNQGDQNNEKGRDFGGLQIELDSLGGFVFVLSRATSFPSSLV